MQSPSPCAAAFVFCHPLTEEKLWTHRVFVTFARELAAAGHTVLRFDYRGNGDSDGIKHLEKKLLKQNAEHKDWECTEELMASTKDGKALYLHCLPADITGVSCEAGEVAATVFDRYRDPLYKQASFKPYIIAAMIFLAKVKDPSAMLRQLEKRGLERHLGI